MVMAKEMILDFSSVDGETRKTRRKELATHRYHATRVRYWERKGCPSPIASWLASQNIAIYPRSKSGRETKSRILMYLREMKKDIADYRREGMTQAQAVQEFLNFLKAKNKRYHRDPYDLFTFGS